MPQYRIEISPNRRAGCVDTLCKSTAVKIQKDELRFGTWVEVPAFASGGWKWKHWGCVSGQQLQHLRELISTGDDEYDYNMVDGYDEMEGEDAEEFKLKLRTAIIEGKIADEDFNGDPEYNVLGQTGIRPRAPRKKKVQPGEEEQGEDQPQNDEGASVANTPASKKRGRGKKAAAAADEDDNDEEATRPAKKAKTSGRKKKAVKAEDGEEDEKAVVDVPKKKGRAAKVKAEPVRNEEDDDGKEAVADPPKKKGRAAKTKAELVKNEASVKDESDAVDEEPAPEKKGRASKVKVEPKLEANDGEELAVIPEKPKRKSRSKKAASPEPALVEDVVDEEAVDKDVLGEAADGGEEPAEELPEPKKGGRKKASAKRGKKSA